MFVSDLLVNALRSQILQAARLKDFAILAYTFMPDHLHLLVEGESEDSNFKAFMRVLRQRTTVEHHRVDSSPLWQDGYYEHVLRESEGTMEVIRYILDNPVRAGIVERPLDYPYSSSVELDLDPR